MPFGTISGNQHHGCRERVRAQNAWYSKLELLIWTISASTLCSVSTYITTVVVNNTVFSSDIISITCIDPLPNICLMEDLASITFVNTNVNPVFAVALWICCGPGGGGPVYKLPGCRRDSGSGGLLLQWVRWRLLWEDPQGEQTERLGPQHPVRSVIVFRSWTVHQKWNIICKKYSSIHPTIINYWK